MAIHIFGTRCTLLAAVVSVICRISIAADPSGGWLSYAVYRAPNASDIITRLSATMVVPSKAHGGTPAFWFGVQTAHGDGALIQPIMSKWNGFNFNMFQEIFDWTDGHDEQTDGVGIQPGDVIDASLTYMDPRTYIMNMTCRRTGKESNYVYRLLPQQKATESVAYFVLEHQPFLCEELPRNGKCSWTNIAVDVNGKQVHDAMFQAKEENPKCGSRAVVNSYSSIDIVWKSSTV